MRVFGALNDDEALSISNSQEILNDNTVRSDIIFIASNYGFLENSITQLEQSMQPLYVQIKIVTDAIDSINLIQAQVARPIQDKINDVFHKNTGFSILKNISAHLTGLHAFEDLIEKYTISETLALGLLLLTVWILKEVSECMRTFSD